VAMREIVQRIEGETGNRGLSLIVVGVLTVVLILGVTRWATAPEWVMLVGNEDPNQVGQMAQSLDDEGIPYRLETRGTGLSVRESDLPRARVTMAREGVALGGRPGFELFDEPSWGMTDFTQRINYRRALEGELERTIGRMRGVDYAQVHLGLQESALLRRSGQAAHASVVVALRGGAQADRSLVAGIASLVSGSVDGLEAADVRIIDDSGRLLTDEGFASEADALTDRQLRVRREVEQHLEQKVEDLLVAVVGEGNLSVRVSADLDFDQLDRTTQTVDGEQQAIIQDDQSEIVPGAPEQGAAQSARSTTFEPSRSIETLQRSGARVARLTAAVVVGHHLEPDGAGAFIQTPREAPELERIEGLVALAVGIQPERGDAITVTNMPFLPFSRPASPPQEPTPTGVLDILREFHRPILGLVGLLLAAGLGMAMMRKVGKAAPAGGGQLTATGPTPKALGAGEGEDAAGGTKEPPKPKSLDVRQESQALPPMPETPRVQDPELTARVIRSWMKEA